ncbi:uncharacterized protein LOC115621524 [Scaptodrosophila lebanonensis]|uniref:RING-type E3 ubiquitin transferase n=1 Tax=Drosophila lebanonensis TaxID=7225 RepID=A0A6J2T6Y4_DROLE|nr:uncharacterized protein LOC115621524 [Scaptodrosophila lebanonensis]
MDLDNGIQVLRVESLRDFYPDGLPEFDDNADDNNKENQPEPEPEPKPAVTNLVVEDQRPGEALPPADDGNNHLSSTALPTPRAIRRQRHAHRILSPYKCNVCHKYVRGGVITICGHMFCWVCLWPTLHGRNHPKCPRCQRRLILHEDIMPFHGEGPTAGADDANIVAQPGNVPRPSGLYLSEPNYPYWFTVNDTQIGLDRRLEEMLLRLQQGFPRMWRVMQWLNSFQLICVALMFVLWAIVSWK